MPARHTAVLTTGHSGSTWLATVLDHPGGAHRAYHEPITAIVGPELPSMLDRWVADPLGARPDVDATLRPYLRWQGRRLARQPVLCEVHAGDVALWTAIQRYLPDRRVLLVRNGIQVVHSLLIGYERRDPIEEHRWRSTVLRQRLPGGLVDAPDDERVFAALCTVWAEQTHLPTSLAPLEFVRLETLTEDARRLRELFAEITGKALDGPTARKLQATVQNSKVEGDRSPESLYWKRWTPRQREIFASLCGGSMTRFGYAIPAGAPTAPAEAPPSPRPMRAARRHGAHAPAWVFSHPPVDARIVVLGIDDRMVAAQDIIGRDRSVTVHAAAPGQLPERLNETLRQHDLEPGDVGGVYLALPEPPASLVDAIERVAPHAEIAWMLPTGGLEVPEHNPDLPQSVGPLRVGQSLSGDWSIDRLMYDGAELTIRLRARDGTRVVAYLEAELAPDARALVPIDGGGLSYRPTEVPFERFEAALHDLGRFIVEALGPARLAEAMGAWRE